VKVVHQTRDFYSQGHFLIRWRRSHSTDSQGDSEYTEKMVFYGEDSLGRRGGQGQWRPTFDMSGGRQAAKLAVGRPLLL